MERGALARSRDKVESAGPRKFRIDRHGGVKGPEGQGNLKPSGGH